MNSTERKMRLADIKDIDLVSYLAKLGYLPDKKYSDYYMYHSPLRDEKTPSFKVTLSNNLWVDYGEVSSKGGPLGGDLITFVMKYHGWTFDEVLQEFNQGPSSYQKYVYDPKIAAKKPHKLTVLQDQPLYSYALISYLQSRGITKDIAGRFCREVDYEINDRKYFAIGFKNDIGGFELRNAFTKISSAPKGITTINNGAKEAAVFEGFMDFLSYHVLHPESPAYGMNFVVLNSIVFFEKARGFLEQHDKVHLYLDQDKASMTLTEKIISSNKKLYGDESKFYAGNKDLNKWLMNRGEAGSRQRQGRRL